MSEDSMKELPKTISEDTPFQVNLIFAENDYNQKSSQNEFTMMFSNNMEALYVFTTDTTHYMQISKEILLNIYYFAVKTECKKICFLLTRKNKDYVKILQGLMTVGFKPSSNSRYNSKGIEYKLMEMEINPKYSEVQEIDF